jgi:peptide chain release factor 2
LLLTWCGFDVDAKEKEIAQIEQTIVAPDFWSDASAAQQKMRHLAELKKTVGQWRSLENKTVELSELMTLEEESPSPTLGAEIEAEMSLLTKHLDDLEFKLVFASPYDLRNAILSIHAGAGGVESQDKKRNTGNFRRLRLWLSQERAWGAPAYPAFALRFRPCPSHIVCPSRGVA